VTGGPPPDQAAWRFERMPPGWHVTTGPGALLHDPRERAEGRYSLTGHFALFPDPSDAGYGLFVGGAGLDGDAPSWLAILLRRDGAVGVVRHRAGADSVLAPFAGHPAVKRGDGRGVVSNRLRVAVAPDSLRVFVNDSAVVAVPRDGLALEGGFGLRIGPGINLHVTILDHTRHLAPVPPRPERDR
jgi:hypothetical protein